jgi:hypothetical protein
MITKDSYTYTIKILRQDKSLRDHGADHRFAAHPSRGWLPIDVTAGGRIDRLDRGVGEIVAGHRTMPVTLAGRGPDGVPEPSSPSLVCAQRLKANEGHGRLSPYWAGWISGWSPLIR